MAVSRTRAGAPASGTRGGSATGAPGRAAILAVVATALAGLALRALVAGQSLLGDELSTRAIVASGGPGDVVRLVHTDAEITPPLSFLASWLATRADLTAGWLRAPALLAGAATLPLVYAVGRRTVGRQAALVAVALTALSPFMIFYATEARAYGLLMALVTASTLALLHAAATPRSAWRWALYAVASCAAMYTHYTAAFPLTAQLGWVLWAHPQARGGALAANAAAAVGFLPWLSGLRGDLESPTTDILSALQPFTPGFVRTSLVHWSVGFPFAEPATRVARLPGTPALAAIAAGGALGLAALVAAVRRRGARPWPPSGAALVLALALAAPAGEALVSAVGANLVSPRNLAASWPGFGLALAAVLTGSRRRTAAVASVLVAGGFAAGAVRMLDADFRRPDFDAAAAFIDRTAAPGDVVIDGVGLAPAGVPTPLEVALRPRRRVFELGRPAVRYGPFRILAPPPPTADVVRRAVRAAGPGRVYLVLVDASRDALAALPPGSRRVAARTYPGLKVLQLYAYAPAKIGA